MQLITGISGFYSQKMKVQLSSNNTFSVEFLYVPQSYGWFIVSMSYGSFALSNLKITVSPNMLRTYKNLIPFGLACYTVDNEAPSQLGDFETSRAALYLLSQAEVKAYETYLQTGSWS